MGEPKASSLRQIYDRVMLGVYTPPPPVLVRGCGSRVWDEAEREYIDFGGGVAVCSLGHSPPAVAKAICRQAGRLMHTSNLYANDAAIRLAQKLTVATFAERVFLCNSGAEANEAAIKLARRWGVRQDAEKYRLLCFDGGFHGRTGFAMAASSAAKVREGFGPLADGFCFAPFNDLPAVALRLSQMDGKCCAVMVEPIQGEGGVIIASDEFLQGLGDLAGRHNALLIVDEIQSGIGRCGDLFAHTQSNVKPQIMTVAKGLGGGFPVGAMLASGDAAAAMGAGEHGSTFGGNPLAAAAALAVLEALSAAGVMDKVVRRGERLMQGLSELGGKYRCFDEVRGRGLFIGCAMSDGWSAQALSAAAMAVGLLLITAGQNTLRIVPALTIEDADIDEGMEKLESVLRA